MKKIIIMAESGSDLTRELAAQYGIEIVPMHVTFENESLDDGTFEVEKIVDYYKNTGKLPKTSGSTPEDFTKAFERIHKENSEADILYIAYSAVTTVSYGSARIASEGLDYVYMLDTKQVSIGQGMIVYYVAKYLHEHPQTTMDELLAVTKDYISRMNMCFMPDNLEFLKAGGRVSNVAFLGARILGLHPVIEIIDGKLTATKKLRGKMTKVVGSLIQDYSHKWNLDDEAIWFVYTIGTPDEVKEAMVRAANAYGFKEIVWVKAHGVITTHGGPAAVGLAGFTKK